MGRAIFQATLAVAVFFAAVSAIACEWRPNQVDYAIAVKLSEEKEQVQGTVHIKLVNHACEAFTHLYFHMYPNAFRWEMDSTYAQEQIKSENPEETFLKFGKGSWIRVDHIQTQKNSSLPFRVEKELMTVDLPEPLAPEQAIELDIPFVTQLGNVAERSGVWDGNFAVSQWFPKLMVYDKKGWALEHNSGYHFVGEFYGDFGSYDVQITAPKKTIIGATGHQVKEEISGDGLSKTHFFHAEQVHDFTWVADRNFIERVIPVGKYKIHVLARNVESLVIGDYAEAAFKYFNNRIGEYPYEDFTVAETYYNGPMEFPQIIFVRSWPNALSRWFDRNATRILEYSVTHETSHQWFFGVVGDNEVVDAWLDEGFATYLEESYNRDTYGESQNIFKFTSLFRLTDTQLSKAVWLLEEPNLKQPIQTPSYQFISPDHYYASAYYKAWAAFRHWEGLIGREKFDQALREYYQTNKFHNAVPDDWYAIVKKYGGSDTEKWFRSWFNTRSKSDYAIQDFETKKNPDGSYTHTFKVAQLGNHYAPVDVDIFEESGGKIRLRAEINPEHHSVEMKVNTRGDVQRVEVDADLVAPDENRFNNIPGSMERIKVWPFTTHTVPSDAVAIFPFPSIQKRSGIGFEAGVFLGFTHYLDWMGTFTFDKDITHNVWDIDSSISTLDNDTQWGWEADYQRDILENKGAILTKKSLGKNILPNAAEQFKVGGAYFGKMIDARSAYGVDTKYSFDATQSGRRFLYSLSLDNAFARDADQTLYFARFNAELHTIVTIYHWIKFDGRAFFGSTSGRSPISAQYDLQAEDEGGMRFDSTNVNAFKSAEISSSNLELQFPVPYGTLVDSFGFVHGPSWELHLFCDIGNLGGNFGNIRRFVDAGIGSRFRVINEDFGKLGFNFEFVPYREVIDRRRLTTPAFLFDVNFVR